MFSSGMELINHTSAYKSIRSLPTKLQFSKCSWWSWTDHCDTVASISYNRCMRVSIWQRGNFTVTIWSMTMFRFVERIGGEGVTKRDATRIVKRGRNGGRRREHAQTNTIKSLFPFSWLKSANIDFIPGQLPSAITRNMGRQPCGVCSWVPDCLAWSLSRQPHPPFEVDET